MMLPTNGHRAYRHFCRKIFFHCAFFHCQPSFLADGEASNSIMSSEGKVALITGITGQDGSYLAEFLLEKGYTVRFAFV
jgi:GDP-mannose 4,6 dehydratase